METKFRMFLQLTEELNFCKAAEKCFVTQQAMSENIRRLEEEYGLLFKRKPRLELTQAGMTMRKALLKINLQEESMRTEIRKIQNGVSGAFTLGINHTRASVLLPKVFPKLHALYPDIRLHIQFGETAWMEKELLYGRISGFLGINEPAATYFKASHIYSDSLFLVLSEKTIVEYFGEQTSQLIKDGQQGIKLRDFVKIPIVFQNMPSTTASILSSYCIKNGISLNKVLTINDFETQLSLCREMSVMTVCPSMFVHKVLDYSTQDRSHERIYAFPIQGLENSLQVDMITPADLEIPVWMSSLIDLITKECLMFSYI